MKTSKYNSHLPTSVILAKLYAKPNRQSMWAREDLNLHALRHTHLKRTCLPITPRAHFLKSYYELGAKAIKKAAPGGAAWANIFGNWSDIFIIQPSPKTTFLILKIGWNLPGSAAGVIENCLSWCRLNTIYPKCCAKLCVARPNLKRPAASHDLFNLFSGGGFLFIHFFGITKGLTGAYSVMVSTRDCGSLSQGSNPCRHPK